MIHALVIAAWVPVVVGLTGRLRPWCALLATLLLVAATIVRITADVDDDRGVLGLFVVVLAVAGGSVVTTAVFELVDQRSDDDESLEDAAQVLRGGTWIGALERLAVFGSIVVGQPAGIALVLAVKGLGRYPELRGGTRPATAERFIIGTLVSVLWAAGCAYLVAHPAPA